MYKHTDQCFIAVVFHPFKQNSIYVKLEQTNIY